MLVLVLTNKRKHIIFLVSLLLCYGLFHCFDLKYLRRSRRKTNEWNDWKQKTNRLNGTLLLCLPIHLITFSVFSFTFLLLHFWIQLSLKENRREKKKKQKRHNTIVLCVVYTILMRVIVSPFILNANKLLMNSFLILLFFAKIKSC